MLKNVECCMGRDVITCCMTIVLSSGGRESKLDILEWKFQDEGIQQCGGGERKEMGKKQEERKGGKKRRERRKRSGGWRLCRVGT